MTDPHPRPDDAERLRYIALLNACGLAEAAGEPLDEVALASELELTEAELESELDDLDSFGFTGFGEDPEGPPVVRRAGRQFLARDGKVPRWQRHFLGGTLDDLNAREALLRAGTDVVDRFREQLLLGNGADYASLRIVPPAFSQAVGERVALDLYAAAVALMARLSADEPAGCVAEEVVAVRVIAEGRAWLASREADGELDHDAAQTAADELNELFALFQDDEVLDLFDMEEPADAALALHDPDKQQLGVVDQRFQSWFAPFGWTAPTGYLKRP
jgi:hypothetical protein